MVCQTLHEYAVAISGAGHANRCRRLIKCKEFWTLPNHLSDTYYLSANVPGDFAAECRAAAEAAARAGMSRPMVMRSRQPTEGMRPDAEENPTLPPQECLSGAGSQTTSREQGRSSRQAEKTATIRPKFRVHLGNSG